MKKAMAILGAVLLVVGMGMSWVGRGLGGQTRATVRLFGRSWEVSAPDAGGWHISAASIRDRESTPTDVASEVFEAAPFTGISLDVDLGDVTIAPGDDYLVEISCWGGGYDVHWANAGDTLMIWSESSPGWSTDGRGSEITVYVPGGAELSCLTVLLDLGDVTLAGLTADTAELDVNLGDVTGEGLTVREYLNVDADLGNVTLYGDLSGAVEIDADLGDVTLGLSRPSSHYNWDLSADMGSITVDGQEHGGFSSSVTGGNGGTILQVDADLGSITVDFDQEQVAYIYNEAVAREDSGATDFGWTIHEPPSVPAVPDVPDVPGVPTVEQTG